MFDIVTTIYISRVLLAKLDSTATGLKMTRSNLAVLLMELYVRHNEGAVIKFRAVKYQGADPDTEWTRCHLTLEGEVYEEFIDLRKIFKRSVSFMISYALVNYLEELTGPDKSEKDNYLIWYQLLTTNYNDLYDFQVEWGKQFRPAPR